MKNALSRTVGVFSFLILISGTLLTQSVVAQNQPPIQVGENIRSIIFGSLTREYLLYVPKGYDSKTPLPLVLLFHGMGMNFTQIMNMSGFGKVAEEKRFIIAVPNYEKGALKNYALTYDIVNFSKELVREISSIVAIDKESICCRIFAWRKCLRAPGL